MNLVDTFEKVRPSIVAFGSKLAVSKDGKFPLFPPLFGTGFIVDKRGIAVTNRHVAEEFQKLPPHPEGDELSAFAMVFSEVVHDERGYGMGAAAVEILRYDILSEFNLEGGDYYGEKVPDIAFVQLNMRELPALQLATESWTLRVGTEVATAGFPLGEDPLVHYGIINQVTPLLRRGIVSSLYPFSCPTPHGFTIDVMSQGGASGSPIFLPDKPVAVGILHAGFRGTNISVGIPSVIIASALEVCLANDPLVLDGVPTFEEHRRSHPGGGSKMDWRPVERRCN